MGARIRELDRINPQIAARMAGCFNRWRRFPAANQALMRLALEGLRDIEGISPQLFEVVNKCLV